MDVVNETGQVVVVPEDAADTVVIPLSQKSRDELIKLNLTLQERIISLTRNLEYASLDLSRSRMTTEELRDKLRERTIIRHNNRRISLLTLINSLSREYIAADSDMFPWRVGALVLVVGATIAATLILLIFFLTAIGFTMTTAIFFFFGVLAARPVIKNIKSWKE